MYAVIKSGGKQYRVAQGQVIRLEKLPAEVGESVELDQVMMVVDGEQHHVGTPVLSGAKVTAEVLEQGRAKKVSILKFKRRKHHMKRMGHRQSFTKVKVTAIAV